jgi:alpha-galactosidase
LRLPLSDIFSFAQEPKGKELPFYKWADTPPIGWNNWNCFGPVVNEEEMKTNADHVSSLDTMWRITDNF